MSKQKRKREWSPTNNVRVLEIMRDTEQDNPERIYSAADIYELSSEVWVVRNLLAELDADLDGVKIPASAAAIMNRFRRLLSESRN